MFPAKFNFEWMNLKMLRLYKINDKYINYLKKFDSKIYENKNAKRPYIGIVYTIPINEINYFVPLSSPKNKHLYMRNSKDLHKIDGGKLGIVNFNNMIPVDKNDLIEIDIDNEPDVLYKNLLKKQYFELLNIQSVIFDKAKNLYLLYKSDENSLTQNDIKIKKRCCNFILLEEKLTEYINNKQMIYNFTEEQKNEIIKNWNNDFYLNILKYLEIYSNKWGLTDFELVEYYSINAIFFCKSEKYGDCVLKMGGDMQDKEFVGEYNTLREYNGKKFVKVYEGDIDLENRKKVMLIERIIPGKTLSEEKSLEKRLAVFSELYNGLHIEPKNPEIYESYVSWVCSTAEKSVNSKKISQELNARMQKAKNICLEICEKYNKKALLHIDIFGDNLVSDINGKYRIIDPKGIIGDPIFETGQFIYSECFEKGFQSEIEFIFAYLEKSINIPNIIIRQCFYIETIRFIFHEYAIEYGIDERDIEIIKFAESVLNS